MNSVRVRRKATNGFRMPEIALRKFAGDQARHVWEKVTLALRFRVMVSCLDAQPGFSPFSRRDGIG